MQCVVLAAGKGTRLHPLTHHRSKAMAPIAGRPMVERVMALFVANGVRDFLLIVSPEDREIYAHFGDPGSVGANSIRLVEQRERLGMAHALKGAVPFLTGSFALTACDNLVPQAHIADLIACQHKERANAVLSLMAVNPDKTASTGIVAWRDGRIERIVEKPQPDEAPSNISSLPLYIFSSRLLPHLQAVQPSPRGEYELQDAIQLLIDIDGGVLGRLTTQRRQLTNVDDLLALNRSFLETDASAGTVCPASVGKDSILIPPLRIEPGTHIGQECVIGPNVVIERDCCIGDNVVVKDAIVLRNRTIASHSLVEAEVVA